MAVRCEMKLDSILAGRALSRDSLDKPCSIECLDKMALKLSRWKVLCPFLGLNSDEEEKILKGHQKNSQRRAGMLKFWREKFGDDATYLKLAVGFESAKMSDMIFALLDWLAENKQALRSAQRAAVLVPRLDDMPKPQQLIRMVGKSGKEIHIRDTITFDWDDLFMKLNCTSSPEETETRLKEIRKNSRDEDQEACREVLLLWLSGETSRTPVTWATLITLLREIKQEELADELMTELAT